MKTHHILSIFTLMQRMLLKRATKLDQRVQKHSEKIQGHIFAREAAASEMSKAKAAAKKLKEFTV